MSGPANQQPRPPRSPKQILLWIRLIVTGGGRLGGGQVRARRQVFTVQTNRGMLTMESSTSHRELWTARGHRGMQTIDEQGHVKYLDSPASIVRPGSSKPSAHQNRQITSLHPN